MIKTIPAGTRVAGTYKSKPFVGRIASCRLHDKRLGVFEYLIVLEEGIEVYGSILHSVPLLVLANGAVSGYVLHDDHFVIRPTGKVSIIRRI